MPQTEFTPNKRFQEPEATRQHLEFIQGVITRLNANSFQIKNWHVTIFSGLVALSVNNGNHYCLYVAAIPSLMFWFLDAYYLQQERKFREMYKDVLEAKIDTYSMPIENYKSRQCNFWRVFCSSYPLYFIPLIVIVLVGLHWHGLCCFVKCLCKCVVPIDY